MWVPAAGRRHPQRSVVDAALRRVEVSVKHQGIEVGTVRLGDGAEVLVDPHLGEERRVGERIADRPAECAAEVDLARVAVAEAELQTVVAEYLHGRNGRRRSCGHVRWTRPDAGSFGEVIPRAASPTYGTCARTAATRRRSK